MIKYDYISDILIYNGETINLEPYRMWLISNHEQLCKGHFIRAVRSAGVTKFTFDWQSIYLKAEEYQFLNDYIHEYKTTN